MGRCAVPSGPANGNHRTGPTRRAPIAGSFGAPNWTGPDPPLPKRLQLPRPRWMAMQHQVRKCPGGRALPSGSDKAAGRVNRWMPSVWHVPFRASHIIIPMEASSSSGTFHTDGTCATTTYPRKPGAVSVLIRQLEGRGVASLRDAAASTCHVSIVGRELPKLLQPAILAPMQRVRAQEASSCSRSLGVVVFPRALARSTMTCLVDDDSCRTPPPPSTTSDRNMQKPQGRLLDPRHQRRPSDDRPRG
jgi:hypothetical protein